jgi:uncharacterized protein (TIGR02217 family)
MTFHDVRFPADISYGSSGGPEYSTDVVVLASGHEQRNINWSNPRARFNVAHGVKTASQLAELIAFFRARQGRAHTFRFKDWSDFQAVNQTLGTGTGSQTTFQMIKSYTSGATTVTRTITNPVNGSAAVYLNGVLQSSGFTINYTTGIITFTSAPGSGVVVKADCDFDLPTRFDTDRLSTRLDDYGVFSLTDIPVIEVRV